MLQYFTTTLTTVCVMQCSSNGASDRSSIPLVNSYPYDLRTAILHHGYPYILRDAMRIE